MPRSIAFVADKLGGHAPIDFPLSLDEAGALLEWPGLVMTGSDAAGQFVAGSNCSDWTAAGNQPLLLGDSQGGTDLFSFSAYTVCTSPRPIYCAGTGINRPLQVERANGRVAFTSSAGFAPWLGIGTADQLCAREARSAGLQGSFKALLATYGASAVSRFDLSGAPWVRTDGIPIVAAARDLASAKLLAAVGVTATGVHLTGRPIARTGASSPATPGTSESTCSSWSSSAPVLSGVGFPQSTNPSFWFGTLTDPCTYQYPVVCLQE